MELFPETGDLALREIRFTGEWPVHIVHWVNVLCIVVLSVTGFALYSQYSPSGLWHALGGPVLQLVGNQRLCLIHHGVMWLLIGFVINHIYSAWLMDVKERNGTLSGIFIGDK